MCQGEPGPPATLWPVPYGPTLLMLAVITPTAPWGRKLGTLPLQSGQTPGYLQGPSVPALSFIPVPRASSAGWQGSGQAQEVSLRRTSFPKVPPATHLHNGR